MNQKLKDYILFSPGFVVQFAILLITIGIAWSSVQKDVQQNAREIAKQDERIKILEQISIDVRGDLRDNKKDHEYIKESLVDIKLKLQIKERLPQ